MENIEPDAGEISAVLSAILEDNSGVEVLKKGGLKVLRAQVTKSSRLVGQTAVDVRFRENYKAAIVAVQQGGNNATQPLSSLTFGAGDILVLQVSDDCPLLSPSVVSTSRKSWLTSMSVFKSLGSLDVEAGGFINDEAAEAVRRDLKVLSTRMEGSSSMPESKEFLVAMCIAPKSILAGKSVEENGITRVPGVYVVGIERPSAQGT